MKLRTAMLTTILSGTALSACSSASYAGSYDNKSYGSSKEVVVKASSVVSKVDTAVGEVFFATAAKWKAVQSSHELIVVAGNDFNGEVVLLRGLCI